MREEEAGSRKRVIGKVVLVTASVLGSLCLAEVLLRVLPLGKGTPAALEIYQADNVVGWIHKPSSSLRLEFEEFESLIEVNSKGLRDRQYDYVKPPGTARIMILGDSFADAVQVDLKATFHELLENRLAKYCEKDQRIEVINTGVDAWGTDQQCLFYETEGRKYKPDVVLLLFTLSNDVRDVSSELILRDRGRLRLKPYYKIVDGQLALHIFPKEDEFHGIYESEVRHPATYSLSPSRSDRFLATVFEHSRVLQLCREQYARALSRNARKEHGVHPALGIYKPTEDEAWNRAWDVNTKFLERLNQKVTADGGQFKVFFVLDPRAIDATARQAYEQEYPRAKELDWSLPRKELAKRLEKLGIPYLDASTQFSREAAQRPGELYFAKNRHWTKAGHVFAAQLLHDWLSDSGAMARLGLEADSGTAPVTTASSEDSTVR